MDFEKQFEVARGYADLGMFAESTNKLREAGLAHRNKPEVLELRIQNLMDKEKWRPALKISRKLISLGDGLGFFHAAGCQYYLGDISGARATLLSGMEYLHTEASFHYNLACYSARLGIVKEARLHLRASFQFDARFREMAKSDPDLETIRDLVFPAKHK
jgi:hypothetical protein